MILHKRTWLKAEPSFFIFFVIFIKNLYLYDLWRTIWINHVVCCSLRCHCNISIITLHIVSALYSLEDDWRNIVENAHLLSEKQTQQQTALWELAETEVAYIKTLKVVTDVSKIFNYNLHFDNLHFYVFVQSNPLYLTISMIELIKLINWHIIWISEN